MPKSQPAAGANNSNAAAAFSHETAKNLYLAVEEMCDTYDFSDYCNSICNLSYYAAEEDRECLDHRCVAKNLDRILQFNLLLLKVYDEYKKIQMP